MSILKQFRVAQTDQQADFATASSLCAETDVLCRAKGLNAEARVLNDARKNLKTLANGAAYAHGKFGKTYEETWVKLAQVCSDAATYSLELGKEESANTLLQASDIFSRMPDLMAQAQKRIDSEAVAQAKPKKRK